MKKTTSKIPSKITIDQLALFKGEAPKTPPPKTPIKKKPFPKIDVESAVDKSIAHAESVFWMRLMGNDCARNNKNNGLFSRNFNNEIKMKQGILDPVLAVRDSILWKAFKD